MVYKVKSPNLLITGGESNISVIVTKHVSRYTGIGQVYLGSVETIFPARELITNQDCIIKIPDFYRKKTATEKEFIDFLLAFVKENKIDIFISGSIFELEVLAIHRQRFEELGCRIMIESLHNIQVFHDKLETINFFKKIGVPALHTEEIKLDGANAILPNIDFPFFIKPRYAGRRSSADGLAVINTEDEFNCWNKLKKVKYGPYVAQAYVNEDGKEYSCAASFDRNGEVKDIIVMERQKVEEGVLAMMAEYSPETAKLEPLLKEIATKIKGLYSFNLQFKMKEGIPYVFEINPRVSGGEAFRSQFGVDIIFSFLSEYCELEHDQPSRRYGTACRIYQELFISVPN